MLFSDLHKIAQVCETHRKEIDKYNPKLSHYLYLFSAHTDDFFREYYYPDQEEYKEGFLIDVNEYLTKHPDFLEGKELHSEMILFSAIASHIHTELFNTYNLPNIIFREIFTSITTCIQLSPPEFLFKSSDLKGKPFGKLGKLSDELFQYIRSKQTYHNLYTYVWMFWTFMTELESNFEDYLDNDTTMCREYLIVQAFIQLIYDSARNPKNKKIKAYITSKLNRL